MLKYDSNSNDTYYGLYGYTSNSDWIPTKFTRDITIVKNPSNSNEADVNVTVSWNERNISVHDGFGRYSQLAIGKIFIKNENRAEKKTKKFRLAFL